MEILTQMTHKGIIKITGSELERKLTRRKSIYLYNGLWF